MKIAFLCQSYPPMISGASLVVQRLAEGMAARGHSVLTLAASDTGKAYIRSGRNFSLVRLRSYPNPVRIGQQFVLWPSKQVLKELRDFQPDLVHLHDPLSTGIAGLQACRQLNIPALLTVHQLPWFAAKYLPQLPVLSRSIETILWGYSRWFLKQCQAVIVPSRTVAEIVYQHTGIFPEIISNGVDLNRFTPLPAAPGEAAAMHRKYALHPGLPIVLYTGRIDADKQVSLVVQAAALAMKSTQFQLLVVGDGKHREHVVRLSEKLGIRDRCCFTGYIPPGGDLPAIYRLAAVFVSASEVETQSLVGLEAAASGLPLVACRAAAIPEIVEHGSSGYLVAPRDVEAMAGRIVELLHSPDLRRCMGLAGRAIASRHSLDCTVDAHEVFFRHACLNFSPGRGIFKKYSLPFS